MVDAHSRSTIEKLVYDPTLEAKKVKVVGDITSAASGASSGKTTMDGTSRELGSNAGSRTVGIQMINRTGTTLYVTVNEVAGATKAYLEDNEGLFLPTNLSVYGNAASGDVVWWEL